MKGVSVIFSVRIKKRWKPERRCKNTIRLTGAIMGAKAGDVDTLVSGLA